MDHTHDIQRPRRGGRYNSGEVAASDAERVAAIQLEASNGVHDGPAWRSTRDDVHVYSLSVLTALIMQGKVWALYHRLGGRPAADLRTPAGGVQMEEAYDLAADTVLGGLPVLRRHLVDGRWDPFRGASVNTWAVNLAILRLPAAWRAWQKARHRRLPPRIDESVRDDERPDAIIYTLEYERRVELLDDDLLEAVTRLDCSGLTDREIGERIDRTVKSVEYQLTKARSLLRRRLEHEARLDRLADGAA